MLTFTEWSLLLALSSILTVVWPVAIPLLLISVAVALFMDTLLGIRPRQPTAPTDLTRPDEVLTSHKFLAQSSTSLWQGPPLHTSTKAPFGCTKSDII